VEERNQEEWGGKSGRVQEGVRTREKKGERSGEQGREGIEGELGEQGREEEVKMEGGAGENHTISLFYTNCVHSQLTCN